MSTGTAGFDSTGTNSSANSNTNASGPAQQPVPPAGSSGSSNIAYAQIPGNTLPAGGAWIDQNAVIHNGSNIPGGPACAAGQTGYYSYDATTGLFLGIVCVANGTAPVPPGPAPSPLALAQRASAQQPWPVLHWGVNPTTGLTGLTSWFWLTGSPSMPDATASAGGLTVTVHATFIDASWGFGDGSSMSSGTDLGRAFPAVSSVQHMYQTDAFGKAGGYLLSVQLRYRVTYSVNGGPFAVLGIKTLPLTTVYQVFQLQPQAVSAS